MTSDFKGSLDKIQQQMKEKEIWMEQAAIARQLIKEIKDPLDLLRELISNSAAKEVEATSITVSTFESPDGQVFEVSDNGIGMDMTGDKQNPGRLERFLSLGFSAVAGFKTDEFGWKGLGSKLTFRSKSVDVTTVSKKQKMGYHLLIKKPWESIEDNRMPKPAYSDSIAETSKFGTTITVTGYPLYRLINSRDTSFDSIKSFLQHRTFVGFTRERENPPEFILKGMDKGKAIKERLPIGFPVLQKIKEKNLSYNQSGYAIVDDGDTVFINKRVTKNLNGRNDGITIHLKGLYTTPDHQDEYGLKSKSAQGLILSVNGIPYCSLDLSNFSSGGITRNPGSSNLCFICECDEISRDMNIGRNGYTASELTQLFERILSELLDEINNSKEYLDFAQEWRERRTEDFETGIKQTIEALNKEAYGWVYIKGNKQPLHRIPQNAQDVLAIFCKLLGVVHLWRPDKMWAFISVDSQGANLTVILREVKGNSITFTPSEIRKIFDHKKLGHLSQEHQGIICWDVKTKLHLKQDPQVPYIYTFDKDGSLIRIMVIKEMKDVIEVKTPQYSDLPNLD